MIGLTFFLVAVVAVAAFFASYRRAVVLGGDRPAALHSRPVQHGTLAAMWAVLAGWAVLVLGLTIWASIDNAALSSFVANEAPTLNAIERELVLADARSIAEGGIASQTDELRRDLAQRYAAQEARRTWITVVAALALSVAAGGLIFRQVSLTFRARNKSERLITWILMAAAAVAVITTVGIVLSLISETMGFFASLDWRIDKFLFGTNWTPLAGVHDGAIDPDRVGALPLFAGTLLITLIAMLVAVPVGLFAAIYLSDFASPRLRAVAKPMLEILAGIPTVVYGFFAAITVAPALRRLGEATGLDIASESSVRDACREVFGDVRKSEARKLELETFISDPDNLEDPKYNDYLDELTLINDKLHLLAGDKTEKKIENVSENLAEKRNGAFEKTKWNLELEDMALPL